jgi:hypothetical protein
VPIIERNSNAATRELTVTGPALSLIFHVP